MYLLITHFNLEEFLLSTFGFSLIQNFPIGQDSAVGNEEKAVAWSNKWYA